MLVDQMRKMIGLNGLVASDGAHSKGVMDNSRGIDGYNTQIDEIRKREYSHLGDQVYLDNAGLPICAKSVVENTAKALLQRAYANPHSQSSLSQTTETMIEETRLLVLKMFNLDFMEYDIVFTQNSSHLLKLVSEGFRDSFESFRYLYHQNSHTSVLGIREHAKSFSSFTSPDLEVETEEDPYLIAWLGQSNFNGQRFPISDWNSKFKSCSLNCYTLFDASSLCSTSPPDFGGMESVPDFICLSFYKIFGYPDLGCLIVNKNAGKQVFSGKKYFSGGTVDAATSDGYVQRRSYLTGLLEEGTLPIHSIIQLSVAMDTFKDIYGSFEQISKHLSGVTQYAINKIRSLSHDNGESMLQVFCSLNMKDQGPIVSFCLLDRNGDRIGYHDFEKYVSARKISVRTGALCNFGAMCEVLSLTTEDITKAYDRGHRCGDGQDVIDGKVKGVIRASLGAMSNVQDIDTLCACIEDYFAESFFTGFSSTNHSGLTVKSVSVYPIKSCAGYSVPANRPWKVTPQGLEFDRLFCLLDPNTKGQLLLKNHPKMTFIRPRVDPLKKIMTLQFGQRSIDISLAGDLSSVYPVSSIEDVRNGVTYECIMDPLIREFLEDVLSVPCVLARPVKRTLHNKSDFLLLSNSSLRYLENYDKDQLMEESSARFRGNIVVQGKDLKPFEEDNWNYVQINNLILRNVELCERCHMITIDPDTGDRDTGPYMKLSKFRKIGGKILFGINCDIDEGCKEQVSNLSLLVGDKILIS